MTIRPQRALMRTLRDFFEGSELAPLWPEVVFEVADAYSLDIKFSTNGREFSIHAEPPGELIDYPNGKLAATDHEGTVIKGPLDPATFRQIVSLVLALPRPAKPSPA